MQRFLVGSKVNRRHQRGQRRKNDPIPQKGTGLLRKFVLVQVRHIPRAENSRADALAKLATTSQEDLNKPTLVEHFSEPSIDPNNKEVSPVISEPSWIEPIWDYLIEGLLPNDRKEASKLRSKSARFTIHRGALYKRGFFTPILKCIAGGDADYVLREVYEGVCGNHTGARALVGKVLRQGYYWPTMLRDATELVRKCKVCQEHVIISHLQLITISSVIPYISEMNSTSSSLKNRKNLKKEKERGKERKRDCEREGKREGK